MPRLDVTDVILDPDFCEAVTARRRTETINDYGESVVSTSDTTIFAVITFGRSDLARDSDGQNQPQTIVVHTPYRLVGPSEGYQPDVVIWRGRHYVVAKPLDYSQYGRGFVSAECTSIDLLDSV